MKKIDNTTIDEPLIQQQKEVTQTHSYADTRIYDAHKKSRFSPILLSILGFFSLVFILTCVFAHKQINSLTNPYPNIFVSFTTVLATAFVVGLTTYISLKIVLRPICQSKEQKSQMHSLVEKLFTDYVFTNEAISEFILTHSNELIGATNIHPKVKSIITSKYFLDVLDKAVTDFFSSAEGLEFEAMGLSKEAVQPIVNNSVNEIILVNCESAAAKVLKSKAISPQTVTKEIMEFLMAKINDVNTDSIMYQMDFIVETNINKLVLLGTVISALLCGMYRVINTYIAKVG